MQGSGSKPSGGDPESTASEHAALGALPKHYLVEREIGRGGMGTVVMARDTKHGRRVAIKVLRSEVARSFGHDRFLHEIRTVASLVHPNIVPVLDSGEAGDTLYFVMPYIEGESLRERLDRRVQLGLDEALRISREVAGALEYAHGQGIVHRDIKPENIILSRDGHAWLVDFGVARASSGNVRLTDTAVIVGSPLYASPEQTMNSGPIDGRSDIYSLGCVLYEMLCGRPPFSGTSMQQLLVLHHTEPPPTLRQHRSDLSPAIEQVVLRMLAKQPADRFANVADLEAALADAVRGNSPGVSQPDKPREAIRRPWVALAGVAAAVIVVGAPLGLFTPSRWTRVRVPAVSGNDARYAILPFAMDSGVPSLGAEDRLADALATWTGIDVVQTRLSRAQRRGAALDVEAAAARARAEKAGRFVHGRISRKGDSLRVNLEVGDAQRPNVTLQKIRLAFPADLSHADRYFRDLADTLILRGLAPECLSGGPATRSLPAVRACDGAFSALEDGELARADTLLQSALAADPRYARAALWLAELRNWIVQAPPDTRALVAQALANPGGLDAREKELARARELLQNAEYAQACGVYRGLTSRDPQDYVAWLGVGECHRRDSVVVRDAKNPSRWAFRSSYHQAIEGFKQAFELKPSLMGGYRARSFAALRDLLLTNTTVFREGKAQGETDSFRSYPSLTDDTIAFTPIPTAQFSQLHSDAWPATLEQAVDRERDLLRQLAFRWANDFPNNPQANEALAVALELHADRAALNIVRRARSSAHTSFDKIRLTTYEVWLQLKFAIPDNPAEIEKARALADSLLTSAGPHSPEEAALLVPMAVLTGKLSVAAALAREAAGPLARRREIPIGVVEPARALLVFAVLGHPVDSIRRLERETEEAIKNALNQAAQPRVRRELLERAAMVGFPNYQFGVLKDLADAGAFTKAQAALMRGDTTEARRTIEDFYRTRSRARPSDLTIDGVYAEAALLDAIGDRRRAIGRLDPTLNALRWFAPGRLDDFVHVGTLMNAMRLRARLADEEGDAASAKKWAAPIAILWSNAEGELQPIVRQMRALAAN